MAAEVIGVIGVIGVAGVNGCCSSSRKSLIGDMTASACRGRNPIRKTAKWIMALESRPGACSSVVQLSRMCASPCAKTGLRRRAGKPSFTFEQLAARSCGWVHQTGRSASADPAPNEAIPSTSLGELAQGPVL